MKTIIKPKTYKILLILKCVLIGIKHMEKDGKNHMKFFIVSTNKSQLHLHNIIFLVSFTVNGEKSILRLLPLQSTNK